MVIGIDCSNPFIATINIDIDKIPTFTHLRIRTTGLTDLNDEISVSADIITITPIMA